MSFTMDGDASVANPLNASKIARYPVHRQMLPPNEFSICCIDIFELCVRLRNIYNNVLTQISNYTNFQLYLFK